MPANSASHHKGASKQTEDFPKIESKAWGDSVKSCESVTSENLFRVVSHNVNGLSTALHNEDVRQFAAEIQKKSVGLFGIQETNRNFRNKAVTGSFHETLKKTSSHYRGAVSSAKLQWPTDYQPGGTAVAVRNEWATRYLSHGHDDLGRWSWITLAGQNRAKITFLSGYRVCDGANESNITSRTVQAQQEWIYANRGEINVDLRKSFITDLCKLTKSLQDQGCDVVLMLDANEARGAKSGVDQIMNECCLADAHAATTDRSPAPATHQRGSEKIDFILVSPRLVEAITSAVILPLQEGYLSDHRALLVDFDATTLFGGKTSFIARTASRRLTSTNPRAVKTYIERMK